MTGEKHHNAKLTRRQMAAIRRGKGNQQLAAAKYGISQAQVSLIRSGDRWR
jgi:hypothetical protein